MSTYAYGGQTYYLKNSITSSDTSIILRSFKEPVTGSDVTMALMNSTIAYGTIAPKTGQSEFISFTGITQNADGTATLTGVTRGLKRGYDFTSSASFKLPHNAGTKFIISDSPEALNAILSSGTVLGVGTTTITSGTNTKVLYNNSGLLGEYTVSGSGNVAMTTSPTFTTPSLTTPTITGATTITVSNSSNVKGLAIFPNDTTNHPLGLQIGPNANKVTSSIVGQINDTDGNYSDWAFNVASNSSASLNFQSSGGTLGSPTSSTNNDILGGINFYGYNSANAQKYTGSIQSVISSVTSGSEASKLYFYTAVSGSVQTRLTIDANTTAGGGLFSTSSSGGVGYATGAGGTVTQASSRTNSVTINTPTGAITLVSAAGSTTPATFGVSNSSVAATDTIIVNQKSGTDKYTIDVTNVRAGGFDITFNTKSGTTTEQPVFNFAVIKGVTS